MVFGMSLESSNAPSISSAELPNTWVHSAHPCVFQLLKINLKTFFSRLTLVFTVRWVFFYLFVFLFIWKKINKFLSLSLTLSMSLPPLFTSISGFPFLVVYFPLRNFAFLLFMCSDWKSLHE